MQSGVIEVPKAVATVTVGPEYGDDFVDTVVAILSLTVVPHLPGVERVGVIRRTNQRLGRSAIHLDLAVSGAHDEKLLAQTQLNVFRETSLLCGGASWLFPAEIAVAIRSVDGELPATEEFVKFADPYGWLIAITTLLRSRPAT